MRYRAPVFKLVISTVFFHVGLCSHTIVICRLCGRSAIVGFGLDDDDRVDPSPCDHQWSTCGKYRVSGCNQRAYLRTCGVTRSADRHQMKVARSRSDGHGEARSSSLRGDAWSVRSPSDVGRFIRRWIFIKRAAKEHQCDRGAIAIRRPGCSRFFSHLSDASGWLDPHRTDDDRASPSLISDDRDHPLT